MTPEELEQNSKDVKLVSRRSFLKLAGITLAGVLTGTLFRSKESTEAVSRPENPIHFVNRADEQTDWFFDNARYNFPPNDIYILTGTVDVSIKDVYAYSFQTKNSLYSEVANGTATHTVIDGLVVDVATWKGYMATAIGLGNTFYARIERIYDVNTPTDYSNGARMLFKDDVVGNIGQNGAFGDFYMGQDSQGKYLDLVIIHAVDPTKNGTYRQRLDNQGNFSGSSFKVASIEPTPTSTRTATPQPSVTATPLPTPTLIYIPSVMKNSSGK